VAELMHVTSILAPHDAQLVEREVPRPGEGEALIRVRAVGLCGSDVHAYEGTHPFVTYPRIPGHEVCGELVEARGECELSVGQRVVLDPGIRCGSCYPCRRGRSNCCVEMACLGAHIDGACVEYITMPIGNVHPAPEGFSDAEASVTETFSIGMQANVRGRVAEGDRVLILGAGPIGLACLMAAAGRGARCAVADMMAARREKARELGAEGAFDPDGEDVAAASAEWTEGDGPDVVIEAVGRPETYREALELVAPAGRVVLLGLFPGEVSLPATTFIKKELDVMGSRLNTDSFPEVIRLMEAGVLRPGALITHERRLDECPAALAEAAEAPQDMLKLILMA
jgi:L-gulonate 5-dehydrogenase